MFKKKVLVTILSTILVCLVGLLVWMDDENRQMFTKMIKITESKTSNYIENDLEVIEVDTSKDNEQEEVVDTVIDTPNEVPVTQEVVEPQPEIVYDGLTLEELASKLDRSLKNELSGKGYLYASYSLEKGVDPYLAVAISLEETGCNWNCSRLVKSCNNVGGMKGSGCGSYGAWSTLDDGIRAFIDNIYRNYVAYGLTTADTMNPKYAENPRWSTNVNNYITRIKNN